MALKGRLVNVVVGKKAYQMTMKMAKTVIDMAKQKYKEEGVNAVVAVKQGDMINLCHDTFEDREALSKEVAKWIRAGYKCYYHMVDEKEEQDNE